MGADGTNKTITCECASKELKQFKNVDLSKVLESKGETQTLRVVPVIFRAQFDFIHLIPFFQKQNVFFNRTRLFAEKRNNLSYRGLHAVLLLNGCISRK